MKVEVLRKCFEEFEVLEDNRGREASEEEVDNVNIDPIESHIEWEVKKKPDIEQLSARYASRYEDARGEENL